MAESIHTILKEKKFVVNHQGNDLTTGISSWFDGIEDLTSLEKIEAWLATKTESERLAFYHYGFDSAIIKNRAACRPKIKTFAKIEDFRTAVKALEDPEDWHVSEGRQTITMNILLDGEAEDRAEGWVPKPKAVPGSSGVSPLEAAVKALKVLGMDVGTVQGILTDKFDPAEVGRIFADL